MVYHQVMMHAPGELRQKYFDEAYPLTVLAASNNHFAEEARQVEVLARKASAEKKLAGCHHVVMEDKDNYNEASRNPDDSLP